MNKKNPTFGIKDLENICGIKAHTIRIWEKRYHLLEPERTETNIRTYNIENLKKLLNVSFLVNYGYKISRISKLTEKEIYTYVTNIVSNQTTVDRSLNTLKIAMLNFNAPLFVETLNTLNKKFTFSNLFYDILLPFLNDVGMLWQVNSINSTHEHFATNIIRQKLWTEIDRLQQKKEVNTEKTYVLYLPAGEINDLSLLFINTLLLSKGCKTIFLGVNVSLDSLKILAESQDNLIFISYFTIVPKLEEVNSYITKFNHKICIPNEHELWVMGHQLNDTNIPLSPSIKVLHSFKDFEKIIDQTCHNQ